MAQEAHDPYGVRDALAQKQIWMGLVLTRKPGVDRCLPTSLHVGQSTSRAGEQVYDHRADRPAQCYHSLRELAAWKHVSFACDHEANYSLGD